MAGTGRKSLHKWRPRAKVGTFFPAANGHSLAERALNTGRRTEQTLVSEETPSSADFPAKTSREKDVARPSAPGRRAPIERFLPRPRPSPIPAVFTTRLRKGHTTLRLLKPIPARKPLQMTSAACDAAEPFVAKAKNGDLARRYAALVANRLVLLLSSPPNHRPPAAVPQAEPADGKREAGKVRLPRGESLLASHPRLPSAARCAAAMPRCAPHALLFRATFARFPHLPLLC